MKVLLSTILATLMIPAAHPAFTPAKSGPVQPRSSSDSKASDGKMTEPERAALIELLTKTKADFIASIQNVSAAQWTFKPTPFTWSVSEAAEHIILSEDLLFGVSQSLLKTPARTPPASSSSQGDQKLEALVGDRTHKVFNPDALKPTGRFKTPAEAIAEFTKRRDHSIEYVRTTQDDLRAHFTPPGPRGQLDAYQYLLLMASHSGRHTAQIREVEKNPKYPAS